jgi:hypothetical protein
VPAEADPHCRIVRLFRGTRIITKGFNRFSGFFEDSYLLGINTGIADLLALWLGGRGWG